MLGGFHGVMVSTLDSENKAKCFKKYVFGLRQMAKNSYYYYRLLPNIYAFIFFILS